MKIRWILLLMFIYPILLNSQAVWDESGIPVRQGDYIEWERSAVSFGNEMIYVWTDCQRGDRDVWAQKIDNQGNKLWDEDVLICGETYIQKDIVITDAGDNTVIIAWVDFRNDYEGDVYAQKLNTNGDILWEQSGVPICVVDEEQSALGIVEDTLGGAFVIWCDNRNSGGTDIYGTRIMWNGNIAVGWENNGNVIIDEPGFQNQQSVCLDGNGGVIAIWRDSRDNDNVDLYMQRVLADGTFAWYENSVLLCGAVNEQEKPKIIPDGTGNFIIIWCDYREDDLGDIYAQRVDLNGDLLWTNEVAVYADNTIQRNPNITSASDNGAIIVWEDGRNETTTDDKDIFIQKLDTNGNLQWDADGVQVIVADNDQIYPNLISDGNGGCWITWEDYRIENHPFGDVYLQHFNSDGNAMLNPNGMIICDESYRQYRSFLKVVNNNVVMVWVDERTGSDELYFQSIDQSGNILLPVNGVELQEGISGDAYDHILLANGDSPIVLWVDSRNGYGSRIFMQVLNPDGTTTFIENGLPVTSHINHYFVNQDAVFNPDLDQVAVVWKENRTNINKIYAQAVDLTGNFLWNPDGLLLNSTDFEQYNSQIDYDDGFYYAGWTDYNYDTLNPIIKVSGQKIDVAGNLLWGDEGVVIAELPGDDVLTDVVSRYYIWRNESCPNYNIYVKLVDEAGNTASGWPEDGLGVCLETGNQSKAKGFLTSQGLLIIWEDDRFNFREIYGQLITSDGNTLWQENGMLLATNDYDAVNANCAFDEDNFYLIWQNYNGDSYDTYLQKFDYSGNSCWPETMNLGLEGTSKHDTNIVICENNVYATWIETIDYDDYVKAQLISDSGNKLWTAGGEIVCESIHGRDNLFAAYNGNDYVYSIWQDDRTNDYVSYFNLYTQKMSVSGTGISNDNVVPYSDNILSNYPNPFNPTTTINFSIEQNEQNEQNEKVELIIYNLKGQKVKTLSVILSFIRQGGLSKDKDNHSVTWNGTDENNKPVSSGIYFYKLKAGRSSFTKKMMLLK